MQNFMLNLLKKNYLKTKIIPEACWTLKIDGAFRPNLKYLIWTNLEYSKGLLN